MCQGRAVVGLPGHLGARQTAQHECPRSQAVGSRGFGYSFLSSPNMYFVTMTGTPMIVAVVLNSAVFNTESDK